MITALFEFLVTVIILKITAQLHIGDSVNLKC